MSTFFVRCGIALLLSIVVALAYAMVHGVGHNKAYHAAVQHEVETAIASGKALTPDDVTAIQKHHASLLEGPSSGPFTIQLMFRAAARETILFTLLVWVIALWGQVRNWGAIVILAVALYILKSQLNLIDELVAVVWLLAAIFSTRTDRRESVPRNSRAQSD